MRSKHSCDFDTFFRPHQIEFAKGVFATLFDALARSLVPGLTGDHNGVQLLPFYRFTGEMGRPWLTEPCTLPVTTEAQSSRSICEQLDLWGRCPGWIQEEGLAIPGLCKSLPPLDVPRASSLIGMWSLRPSGVSSVWESPEEDPASRDDLTCKSQLTYEG